MKKIFTLLFVGTFLYSCSGDGNSEINEHAAVNLETQNNQGVFDNSKLGVYKGVFTTLDGQSRATLQIELDGKNDPTAEFNFPDSNKASLSSGNQVSKSASTDKIKFSDTDFSFDFSVEEGGLNPIVSNVTYKGQKGDVIILKETSKAPVSPKTGTYSCLACNDHPELGQGKTQTFNTVLQNTADGTSEVNLQATLIRRVFGGQLTQSGCSTREGLTQCNLNGELEAGSGPVVVSGTHLFDNIISPSPDGDCSDLSGTFLYSTDLWGDITMTFKTDAPGNCF